MEMLNLVSEEDNDSLLQPIKDSKIKEVVFRMDKFKVLRSNGFGDAFFQDYWNIVQEEVCTMVDPFLNKENSSNILIIC